MKMVNKFMMVTFSPEALDLLLKFRSRLAHYLVYCSTAGNHFIVTTAGSMVFTIATITLSPLVNRKLCFGGKNIAGCYLRRH